MNKKFSAVLVAGGASSRMGMPKALVRVDGEILWRRQIGMLKGLGPEELMISAGLDWNPGEGTWTLLRDRTPGLGPLEGIGVAMASMSTDLLLVLAIDMPSMSAAYLRGLVAAAGPMGIVPSMDGCYEGLAAVYPRSSATLLEDVLIGADRSMQNFIRRAKAGAFIVEQQVPEADRRLFRNVNRPGDL